MSNKTGQSDTLRNLAIAGAVFFTLAVLGPKLLPDIGSPKTGDHKQPPPAGSTGDVNTGRPTAAGPSAGSTGTSPGQTSPGQPGTAAVGSTSGAKIGGFAVLEAPGDISVTIGSPPAADLDDKTDDEFRARLTLSNVGASVESATMTDHRETNDDVDRYELLKLIERDDGRRFRSLAVENVNIDGVDVPLRDKRWQVKTWDADGEPQNWTQQDGRHVVEFYVDVTRDDKPVLRLTRRFALPKYTKASRRHDVLATTEIANLTSDREHRVVLTFAGGIGIRIADSRMDDRRVNVGLRGSGGGVYGESTTPSAVSEALEKELFSVSTAETGESLSWAATDNKYFSCTLAPIAPGSTLDEPKPADTVASVLAVDADGNPSTLDDVTLRMVMLPRTLAPGERGAYPIDVYLGEKDSQAFRSVDKYAARNYYFQSTQAYGVCTFTWLVELMIFLLNGLNSLVGDFGVAIIILVMIVRTLLHPITRRGQVSMVRMQKQMGEFAPKIDELKKKYAGDKVRLQQETMKLYKEHGINPAGQLFTCLPMMLQMPIWFALYISLSNNILMRHEPFLFTWIRDLTAPDCLYQFASPVIVPFVGWELPCFNLLPILVAVAMFAQQKLQPKPKPNPNATDQQRQQQEMMQKMMPMMSIMMLFFFYKMPAGLNLYIMTSSFFGTLEQIRIRKHIRKQEEAGTFDKPKKTAAPPDRNGPARKPGKPSFFGRLQSMAEEAQKQQRSQRSGKQNRPPKR